MEDNSGSINVDARADIESGARPRHGSKNISNKRELSGLVQIDPAMWICAETHSFKDNSVALSPS